MLIAIAYVQYVCNPKVEGTYVPPIILSGQPVVILRFNMLTDIQGSYVLLYTL